MFSYSAFFNLTQQYVPPVVPDSSGSTSYAYNLDRQLVRTILPDSSFIDVIYDSTGCVSCGGGSKPKEIVFDRGVTEFNYSSSTGQLSEIISPSLDTLRYTYDGSLPTSVSWAGAVNGNVGVTYNNDFRVTSQSVNGGNTVGFSYDDDGLLTGAGNLSIARNPENGLMTGSTLGNVTTKYEYDDLGQITGYCSLYNTDSLFSVYYILDNIGRITHIKENANGNIKLFDYSYDLSGRLEQVFRNGTLILTYSYDSNGNRLSHITPTETITGVYDDQDRMQSYGRSTYTYDLNGNLTSKTDASGTTYYDYDNLGNLVAVQLPDGTDIEYLIDGQNRRIGKKVDGVLQKQWIYQDQINPVAELDSLGNISARFVYGTKGHVPDYMIKEGVTYSFITDYLGSVRLVVDAAGTIVQSISYDEFGNVLSNTNPEFQPFGYAGGLVDEYTDLVRFGARDYDASVGRWTAKDLLKFFGGGFNFYNYVNADPINFIDPFGLSDLTFDRSDGTVTLYDNNGNQIGQWDAANNVVEGAEQWPTGTFDYSWWSPHTGEDENDACGSYGNFIFEVSGREGMGVHAGRADQQGINTVTEGCIRTSDDAMQEIYQTHQTDPLNSITVQE